MTSKKNTVSDIELQAFIDNELDSVRHAEIEILIRNNPELQLKAREYMQINQGLKDLFQHHLNEKTPEKLTEIIKIQSSNNILSQVASLFIAVIIGLVLGWYSRGEIQTQKTVQPLTQQIIQDAFSYHAVYTPEIKHPVEVSSEHEEHLVKWLSKRLKTPVKAPDFSFAGFELLGGRLLSSDSNPAAQFMYENSQGQRLTLFTRQKRDNENQTEFRYARKNNMNGFYWTDNNLSFVILSEISKNKIYELVTKVCNKTKLN